MRNLLSTVSGWFHRGRDSSSEALYVQHPMATTLDDALVIPGNDGKARSLNETAAFIWKHTKVPTTKAAIVSAIVQEFDVRRTTASSDVDLARGGRFTEGLA